MKSGLSAPVIILVIIFISIVAGALYYLNSKPGNLPQNSPLPAINSPKTSPASSTPVNQPNVPSDIKSTISTPTKSTGNTTNNTKNLQDCLARASNSEAQKSLIDEAIKDCYEKYK